MEKSFSAETEADPAELFSVVADLGTYPEWLDVVAEAEPVPSPAGDGTEDEPVWSVTLRARIGPLARSKRLRMCRTDHLEHRDAGGEVRFERCEDDSRDHSGWAMSAVVSPTEAEGWCSVVELTLRYDGGMWTGALDGLLDRAAERATDRLRRHVSAQPR